MISKCKNGKLTLGGVAKGLILPACIAAVYAWGISFLETKYHLGADIGVILTFAVMTFAAMIFAFGLCLLVNHMIVRYSLKRPQKLAIGVAYVLLSALVTLTLLKLFSIGANMPASNRTLLLFTAMLTFISCFIAKLSLNIALTGKMMFVEEDDDEVHDDEFYDDFADASEDNIAREHEKRYVRNFNMSKEYALVLLKDEYHEFLKQYRGRVDSLIDQVNAIDKEWGEKIYVDSLFADKPDVSNIDELSFLPSHLDEGFSLFHFEEYSAEDYQCEQLISSSEEARWRDLKGSDVIALYVPGGKHLSMQHDYEGVFRNVLENYLPESFGYSEHMGPLRIYDESNCRWNFERSDAESYAAYLNERQIRYMEFAKKQKTQNRL